jgi:hypothetical protein
MFSFSEEVVQSNVKAVKEQTFQQRSTNVPEWNRNVWVRSRICLIERVHFYWSMRAYSGPNRNNLFWIRQIRERYQNVLVSFQNDIGSKSKNSNITLSVSVSSDASCVGFGGECYFVCVAAELIPSVSTEHDGLIKRLHNMLYKDDLFLLLFASLCQCTSHLIYYGKNRTGFGPGFRRYSCNSLERIYVKKTKFCSFITI